MTWCFGKKISDAVFLFADSVKTSSSPNLLKESSFGEAHINGTDNSSIYNVAESCLKIYRVGEMLITFAGDISDGEAFIASLQHALGRHTDSTIVIKEAASNTNFSDLKRTRILVAFYLSGPHLVLIDSSKPEDIEEIDSSIHLGSVPELFTELTESVLKCVPPPGTQYERWVTQPLALLQSYGLHHYMMESGVGGAFACAWIDGHGFHWQPDILYVLNDDSIEDVSIVGVSIREEVMSIFTNASGSNRILVNNNSDSSSDIFREQVERSFGDALKEFDDARFDFVVFLNYEKHIATVVEMNKEHKHQLVVVEPFPGFEGKIKISWSPTLVERVRNIPQAEDGSPPRDLCLRWEPFRQLTEDDC